LIKENEELVKHEAFIVMIISHGEDEQVLGINVCRELNNKKRNVNDLIKISEIDVFSDNNCKYLRQAPKLFFFNFCRVSKL
jgi:hypothetical protein